MKFLTAEAELALLKDRDNPKSVEKLIVAYMPMIKKIVGRYRRSDDPLYEDLIQEARLGLFKAIQKHDIDTGYRLSTYGVFWIRNNLNEFMFKNSSIVPMPFTHRMRSAYQNYTRALVDLGFINGDLTSSQVKVLSERLNISEDETVLLQSVKNGIKSFDAKIDEGDDFYTFTSNDEPTPEEVFLANETNQRMKERLAKALSKLSDKHRKMVQTRYIDFEPMKLVEVARSLGVSAYKIKQAEARLLKEVRRAA